MKKLQLFCLVGLLAIVAAAAPAKAFTFGTGQNKGKMQDFASFFTNGAPAAQGTVEVGYLDREIFQLTSLATGAPSYTNSYYANIAGFFPQLTGVSYDLAVGSIDATDATNVVIELVAAGRYADMGYSGGRVDFWENPTFTWEPAGNNGYASDWVEGTPLGSPQADPFQTGPNSYDTFPNVTEGNGLLSGTFVPNGDGTIASGAYAGDDVLLTLTLDLTSGTGKANQGYIKLLYNGSGSQFVSQTNPAGYAFDISFSQEFYFAPVGGGDPPHGYTLGDSGGYLDKIGQSKYWNTGSEDPLYFTILPEPATLSLFGMALVGLGGLVRKRRS